ncbi:MAG: 50S ribosomal protein L21 [Patescibacteria group bacterium]
MYAVITTGGKQYLVTEGQVLSVEKIELAEGETLTFEPMLVADADGNSVKVGTPIVAGSVVTAKIVEHGRGEKISVIKYKPKTRYRRNVGHRQPYTKISIETIA